jgi:hypothetical protein
MGRRRGSLGITHDTAHGSVTLFAIILGSVLFRPLSILPTADGPYTLNKDTTFAALHGVLFFLGLAEIMSSFEGFWLVLDACLANGFCEEHDSTVRTGIYITGCWTAGMIWATRHEGRLAAGPLRCTLDAAQGTFVDSLDHGMVP